MEIVFRKAKNIIENRENVVFLACYPFFFKELFQIFLLKPYGCTFNSIVFRTPLCFLKPLSFVSGWKPIKTDTFAHINSSKGIFSCF